MLHYRALFSTSSLFIRIIQEIATPLRGSQ